MHYALCIIGKEGAAFFDGLTVKVNQVVMALREGFLKAFQDIFHRNLIVHGFKKGSQYDHIVGFCIAEV